MSHAVHRLSFGKSFPRKEDPLSGFTRATRHANETGTYKYFLKVVPVTYTGKSSPSALKAYERKFRRESAALAIETKRKKKRLEKMRARGVEGGGGGGGVYRRRRANTTWRRSDRNVPRPEGSVDADEGESSSSFEEDLRNFRGERVYKARGGIGSSLDGRGRGGIGSSLDAGRGARGGRSSSNSNSNSRGGIGSSLDGSVDASGSVDGSMDDLYRSYVLGDAAADRWDDDDERGDSLDDELRQSWLKDSGYYSVDETIDDR